MQQVSHILDRVQTITITNFVQSCEKYWLAATASALGGGVISVEDDGDPDLLKGETDYEARLASPSTMVVAVVVNRKGK